MQTWPVSEVSLMGSAKAVLAILFLAFLLPSGFSQSVSPANWETLDKQLEQAYLKGDLAEGIRVAKLAVEAASTPQQSGKSLDRLGYLYYVSGNFKDGEAFLRQGLEIRRTKVGPDTEECAESLNDLALFCRDTRKLAEAKTLAEEAVAIRARVLDAQDPVLAETLETLGSIYSARGEYELSASTFQKARAIYESQLDPANPRAEYGTLLVNIAGNDQRLGKYRKAEADFQLALEVLRKNPGVNHPIYGTSVMGFANLEMEIGNYAASEKAYNEAEPLMKKQLGDQHPMYVHMLNNRAVLFEALGNPAAAKADYQAALEARQKLYGPNHVQVAAILRNYGRLMAATNPAEGEKLLREAVDIYAKAPDHPAFEYANTLLALGEAQRKLGDLAAARKTVQTALEVAEQGLGTKHPVYADALGELALIHQAAREYAEAERRFHEAIDIVGETDGRNHPDLARYIERLAMLYDEEGKYRDAAPLYRASFDINDRLLTDILNVGSESNKVTFLQNLEDPIPSLISFQQRAGGQVPEARALAFEAIARRKGRVLDQVRGLRERLAASPDPALRKRFNEWEAMLQCQSSLTIALGYRDLKPAVASACSLEDTGLEGRYERLLQDLRAKWTPELGQQALGALQVLRQRRDTLEAALSRDSPQFVAAVSPVRLEDMQSNLAPEELFIEFIAYQPVGSSSRTQPGRRYGAFLLNPSGAVRWVDLGPAAPIDGAVRDLFEAANDWSVAVGRRENQNAKSLEGTANDARRELSRKLLAPLEPWLSQSTSARRLRIAPDGMLTLVPFGALSDARGRFLVERFALDYVLAGRDLADSMRQDVPAGPPIIALSPGAGASRPASRSPASRGLVASVFRADRLERLEGAEAEARKLQSIIPRSQLLAEGQATEERVKQLHSPALLHIVGHGIVRGNEDCKANPSSPGCAVSGLDPASRAMSLSAIVLEEAYGRGAGSPEDGWLTALELQTLDLRGTALLVLSQCQMAGGVASSGEGVYGMRRAAAIAGARTFVAPLWKVADAPEQALMERFYKELSAGRSRVEALRLAELQLLKNPETGNFLYWAPVILSGDPSPLPKAIFAQ
jgi:CHAT domain-containing protein/tetratricopeptide (TPR) repeat protein